MDATMVPLLRQVSQQKTAIHQQKFTSGSPQHVQRNATNGIEIRQVECSKSMIEKQWCLPNQTSKSDTPPTAPET